MARASEHSQLPDRFDFTKPEEWPVWLRQFERYLRANDITSEERQIDRLLLALGRKAESILLMFALSAEDVKKYQTVRDKFNAYFVVRRNVIYKRTRCNRRNQGDNESIESYLRDLYELVETCEYGTMRDELLRDRIVVGFRDQKLSEALQLDEALTLTTALAKVRAKAMISKQSQSLAQLATPHADFVKRSKNKSDAKSNPPRTQPTKQSS